MKYSHIIMSAAILPLAVACGGNGTATENNADAPMIDKTDFKATSRIFSIEAMGALGRLSSPTLSPDGKTVLYSLSYESLEQNRSNACLYTIPADGGEITRITNTPKSESNAVWIDGGKRIAFLSTKSGKGQVWVMNADGSARKQLTNVEAGVDGFRISPDQSRIVMISPVKYARTAQDVYPDLPKATGRIIDDLMYKHWDEWVTEIPHPFIAEIDLEKGTCGDAKDVMSDEPFEAPVKPFGGIESIAWTPDSKGIVYVSKKSKGQDYALSTNSNLYQYDIAAGTTVCLTEGNNGYDTNPVFSPDGTKLAWLSMEHDGYESDKNRIMVLDTTTGEKCDITANWDYTVDDIQWAPDSKSIYFLAYRGGVKPIFNIALDTKEVKTVAEGVCDYEGITPMADGSVLALAHSLTAPNDLYRIAADGTPTRLTEINADIFAQVDMPTVEKRMIPATDGKEITTWVVYPPNFDPNKKYPAILYCQGGPQSAVSQFWSYRWNLSLMASQGYIVIAPNRRGLPGFGTEWNAQISGDYGGQNMRDYLSAVDYMKKEAYVDGDHIGAVGASYGGFSVYWLAGHHDNRFACLIAHAGIFNLEAQYLETEELFFANWDLGGPFWDKSNATAQRTFATSPHNFVDQWTSPILITHGEHDYRILSSQGEMAFNAARLRGIPAEMVIFPDENHWILKPQNAVLWQRVFFRWLDRWLKNEK
ncbi:MAG: S9 family peptidase [Muribaculaceae bacterium]|nr:S9 family peptidase [Muribaculaceae bacterium]